MDELFHYGRKGIIRFFKENRVAILYTLIIHLVILIIMIFVKVEGLKNGRELGIELEFDAREVYEKSRGVDVELPGFIEGDNLTGCTPDGVVGEEGLLEIKCPMFRNYAEMLFDGIPENYNRQVQFQMMVTGADWCDFMIYHPDFSPKLRAKVWRVKRDEELIKEMRERVVLFNELIETLMQQFDA